LTGTDIAFSASLGPGILIPHPVGIVIGGSVTIGEECTIMHGVTLGERLSEIGDYSNPRIGDRVLLGAGSVCLGGISIGSGSTVGANAVVLIDVPDECTAIGVPARIISSRDGLADIRFQSPLNRASASTDLSTNS
jgi:serine O-acetyltransferase